MGVVVPERETVPETVPVAHEEEDRVVDWEGLWVPVGEKVRVAVEQADTDSVELAVGQKDPVRVGDPELDTVGESERVGDTLRVLDAQKVPLRVAQEEGEMEVVGEVEGDTDPVPEPQKEEDTVVESLGVKVGDWLGVRLNEPEVVRVVEEQ